MVDKILRKAIWLFILLILPAALYAQRDVTKFLDIPVDGFKPEMIQKLKSKGFTISKHKEDILNGEFNGIDVNLSIGTNNNKVWRIAVFDTNPTDETNIKIRFNNLIQQFANNKRYLEKTDSAIANDIIPKDEDISYEIKVKNKRYESAFYQRSLRYDSLTSEKDLLTAKETLNDKEKRRFGDLIVEIFKESLNCLNKQVWFMIKEDYGEYRIVIFYENENNKANGEGL